MRAFRGEESDELEPIWYVHRTSSCLASSIDLLMGFVTSFGEETIKQLVCKITTHFPPLSLSLLC